MNRLCEIAILLISICVTVPINAYADGYTITIATATDGNFGGGSVTISGYGTYSQGSTVMLMAGIYTVIAIPPSGASFWIWTPAGSVSYADVNAASTTATITGTAILYANFRSPLPKYALSISANSGGSTSPTGASQQLAGTCITVTGSPYSGYSFSDWSISGTTCNSGHPNNECQFLMPANSVVLAANFVSNSIQSTVYVISGQNTIQVPNGGSTLIVSPVTFKMITSQNVYSAHALVDGVEYSMSSTVANTYVTQPISIAEGSHAVRFEYKTNGGAWTPLAFLTVGSNGPLLGGTVPNICIYLLFLIVITSIVIVTWRRRHSGTTN